MRGDLSGSGSGSHEPQEDTQILSGLTGTEVSNEEVTWSDMTSVTFVLGDKLELASRAQRMVTSGSNGSGWRAGTSRGPEFLFSLDLLLSEPGQVSYRYTSIPSTMHPTKHIVQNNRETQAWHS